MALRWTLLAAAAAGMCVCAQTAMADDTGLAGMHSWMKVGRKTCFTDHTHTGNSSGHRTQRQALKAAIEDWQGFTAFEYGTDWAYFRRANARMKSCSKDSQGWGCTVEGRPCRGR